MSCWLCYGLTLCLQTVALAPGAFPHLQNGDDIHMLSFVSLLYSDCRFFEPRLFFTEVLFSLSVIPALLLISVPVSLHRSLTCVKLSIPSGFANTVRALS